MPVRESGLCKTRSVMHRMTEVSRSNRLSADALILFSLSFLTFLVYSPGLHSPFLLDDFYNLQNLDLVKDYGFNAYLFSSGVAGPSGRPLSLLTFALQYNDWPANPAAFKAINLFLHLANGALVFLLSSMLARLAVSNGRQQLLIGVITSFIWMLHPIQISTTLYVIQRMTQLSTLYILLGVLAYFYYRNKLIQDSRVLIGCLFGLVVLACMFLAILSKEIGILLPVYILAIEITFFARTKKVRHFNIWKLIVLLFPLLFFAGYLAIDMGDTIRSYYTQEYSMQQKLLTEFLVLFDYLKNIALPRPSVFGLYHDDYQVVQNIVSPPATLLMVIVLAVLGLLGFKFRKKHPVPAFAIFWFFGGHLLESTYLNLELYFEHRNYLPSFGICFFIAWTFVKTTDYVSNKKMFYFLIVVYCFFIIAITVTEIEVWSKPGMQAQEWARRHPQSYRSLNDLLAFYVVNEDYDSASVVLTDMEKLKPDNPYPDIQKINITNCKMRRHTDDMEWDIYIERAGSVRDNSLITVTALDVLIFNILNGSCPNINFDKLRFYLITLSGNTGVSVAHGYINEYLAYLEKYSGDLEAALSYLRRSIVTDPTVPKKIFEINLLIGLGRVEEANDMRSRLEEDIKKSLRLNLGYGKLIKLL